MSIFAGVDVSREACEARMRDGLLHATLNEREHDQRTWGTITACGTRACFFGTVIIHEGMAEQGECFTDVYEEPGYWLRINKRGTDFLAEFIDHGSIDWDLGSEFTILGALLMDLTSQQAYDLSDIAASLGDLWERVAIITEGRVTCPPELRRRVELIDEGRLEML